MGAWLGLVIYSLYRFMVIFGVDMKLKLQWLITGQGGCFFTIAQIRLRDREKPCLEQDLISFETKYNFETVSVATSFEADLDKENSSKQNCYKNILYYIWFFIWYCCYYHYCIWFDFLSFSNTSKDILSCCVAPKPVSLLWTWYNLMNRSRKL